LEIFMVSTESECFELFMPSAICIGTRLIRRAANRRSIDILGFLEAGGGHTGIAFMWQ
jgi:hypothetical protein